MKVYMKIHKAGDREVVAVCDSNLVGKCFREKNLKLDVTERFYKGTVVAKDKVIKVIKEAHTVNLVGEAAVELGLQAKIILKENIIKIKGIPHAMSVQYE
ncbi:MAG: DUF424 family protein [Candidatus Nanoarchaeia archaeon]